MSLKCLLYFSNSRQLQIMCALYRDNMSKAHYIRGRDWKTSQKTCIYSFWKYQNRKSRNLTFFVLFFDKTVLPNLILKSEKRQPIWNLIFFWKKCNLIYRNVLGIASFVYFSNDDLSEYKVFYSDTLHS